MVTEKTVAASAGSERDDLEIITDIGPKYAAALYQIGVLRFEDLAQYTPPELSQALLDRAGVKVLAKRILTNQWIDQARELAQHTNLGQTTAHRGPDEGGVPQQTRSKRTWDQYAAFSIFFDYELDEHGERVWQTRVYDNESGVEELLPGVEPAVWVNWILERARLPVAVEPIPTPAETEAPVPAPTVVMEPVPTATEAVEPVPAPTEAVEPVPTPIAALEPACAPIEAIEPSLSATLEGARTDSQPLPELEPTVYFQYLGRTGLTVVAPRTRKRYHFDRPGAVVAIDPRDRRSLGTVSVLRQVRKPAEAVRVTENGGTPNGDGRKGIGVSRRRA
jgi:hypothetical protein